MIRIALETSTAVGSVAVGRGDRVLAEAELHSQARHAEQLVPTLESVLARAGIRRQEIGEVVVGAGPGSFTGVRVAGATAKGLVAALGVPLRAYPSLLALVAGETRRDRSVAGRAICALFDARRGEAYAGCWRVSEAGVVAVLEPMVGPVAAIVDATRLAGPTYVGDGAIRYHDALQAVGAEVAVSAAGSASAYPAAAAPAAAYPHARDLIWLAEHHPGPGRVDDVGRWQPMYVRDSSATPGG
jgi:tRNA threonylcarbamoyladenosine biosynthesis protein TsaB